MARFYTSATNSRGNIVTAGAHQMQEAHCRGWSSGVKVIARQSDVCKDDDVFEVYQTSGSDKNGTADRLIGKIVAGKWVDERHN